MLQRMPVSTGESVLSQYPSTPSMPIIPKAPNQLVTLVYTCYPSYLGPTSTTFKGYGPCMQVAPSERPLVLLPREVQEMFLLSVLLLLVLHPANTSSTAGDPCPAFNQALQLPSTHFQARPPGARAFQFFDAFLFNGEWEMLEIRLHELAPVVHRSHSFPSD